MNRNPKQTIQQLATFLGVEDNEEFLEKVQEACKFDKMKKVEEDNKKELPEALAKVAQAMNTKMVMIRKGIIGDWKNELTREQIDQLDTYIAKEMEKGLEFKFIYE
uniref:Sulfotransferase domain-containing protein n=1 Tax=Biomphalaria glabrata TaxID=6526 RepID=A0A2C9L6S2_BIOGL